MRNLLSFSGRPGVIFGFMPILIPVPIPLYANPCFASLRERLRWHGGDGRLVEDADRAGEGVAPL